MEKAHPPIGKQPEIGLFQPAASKQGPNRQNTEALPAKKAVSPRMPLFGR
jgi:hypothetical protein